MSSWIFSVNTDSRWAGWDRMQNTEYRVQNNETEHLKEIENLKLEHSQQIYMMRRMNWANLKHTDQIGDTMMH